MKVKKTVLELLEELPPNLRELTRNEIEPIKLANTDDSLFNVLCYSFRWWKSPVNDPVEFWSGVSNTVRCGLPLDKYEEQAARHLELMSLNGNNVALAKQLLAEEEQENG